MVFFYFRVIYFDFNVNWVIIRSSVAISLDLGQTAFDDGDLYLSLAVACRETIHILNKHHVEETGQNR